VFTHPEWLFGFDAAVGTLFCRAFGVNFHEVRAFALLRYSVAPLPALLLEDGGLAPVIG